MNMTLLAYVFYEGSSVNSQRADTSKQVIEWQVRTDTLMANCVSKDVMELVVNALERDRELYRRQLPTYIAPVPPVVPPLEPKSEP
jgi:hypothetical protein